MALALYRKYRPRTFAEVIGQEHVTEPLSQALRSGRLQPRLPLLRPARLRQDLQRPDPGPLAQLREGPDPGAVRRVRLLPWRWPPTAPARSTSSRSTRPATAASTTPATCASAPSSRRLAAASRSTSSTRRTWSRRPGLQRPAQAGRGAAGVRQVRLRDHRAGEGPRHDQVADPPLPVPADPAERAAAVPGAALRRPRASAVEPAVFPLVVRAGGGIVPGTRLSVLDQLIAGAGAGGRHLRPGRRAARGHRRRR